MLGDSLDDSLRHTGLRVEPSGWRGVGGSGEPAEVQLKVKTEPRTLQEKPPTLPHSGPLRVSRPETR